MAASDFIAIAAKLRSVIRDDLSTQWNDAALHMIINEAQREYSFYSGGLTGKADIIAPEKGVLSVPDDFIEPLKVVDVSGRNIPIVSYKKINQMYLDFTARTAYSPECVCFDFDGYGKFRVFPLLPAGTKVGTLIYRRTAARDKIETSNIDAVINHCLFQLFFFSGKEQAQNYWQLFIEAVNAEARSNKTMRNYRRVRSGVFF